MVDGFLAAALGDKSAGIGMSDQALIESQRLGDSFLLAWALFGQAATHFVLGNAIRMDNNAARAGIRASAEAGWKWAGAICGAYLGRSLLMQHRVEEAVAYFAKGARKQPRRRQSIHERA